MTLLANYVLHLTKSPSELLPSSWQLLSAMQDGVLAPCDAPQVDALEPAGLSDEQALQWAFLLDTLNFCFWSDGGELFGVSLHGKLWTGYHSLCAALCRTVEVQACCVRVCVCVCMHACMRAYVCMCSDLLRIYLR